MSRTTRIIAGLVGILALSGCGPSPDQAEVTKTTMPATSVLSTAVEVGEAAEQQIECVYPIQDDDSCVVVSYVADEIVAVEPYPDGMTTELQLACTERDHAGACEVLVFVGSAEITGD